MMKPPKNFLQAQGQALGFRNPADLAEALEIPPGDVVALWKGYRWRVIEADLDPVFAALATYVDKQIGAYLAVRTELQRKLDIDRRNRAEQRQRAIAR